MKLLRTLSSLLALCALFCAATFPARAADDLVISELMAVNDNTLADEDGDFEDWIEIFNAGANTVDLNGWYLTDAAGNLTKWRFPATNLTANSYLVVFASGKDRRIAGRPLHSNFSLNSSGEYVALVKPDGTTVQFAYSPSYSNQVVGISYGLPVTTLTTVLVSNGAAGRFTVPLNGNLGDSWTQPGFNDAAWTGVNNGVGFEGGDANSTAGAAIADSASEFGGNQGSNGWFYGYWDKKADANGNYEPADFIAFPRGTGNVINSTNYFNGTVWMFPAPNNPPWTSLTRSGGHPNAENGNTSLPVHWAIRRYVSETSGALRLSGIFASSNLNGTCGDGIVGRILVDGNEVWNQPVFGTSLGYSIVVNASVGSLIDFVIDAGQGNNDSCDTTTFTAGIRPAGDMGVIADTMLDWSDSGVQGQNGWAYGYFNRTTGGTYAANKFTAFPSGTGPHSTGNYWNGEAWQWFDGDPPFDTIGQVLTQPSIFTTGGVNGNEHWVIRRWTSGVSGTIQVDWHIAKKDLTGGGVIGTIFQNGTQRDTFTLAGADFVGTNRTITIAGVQVGDFIDIAVAPGADIIGDICFLNATIHGSGTLSNQFASNVGTLMTNINASAYLRLPFTVSDAAAVNGLTLRMKYDDGFVAYLNGARVASANARETNEWNASAAGTRPDAVVSRFQDFNLDNFRDFLIGGANVLAIHGLNSSPTDPDFLIVAELLATRAAFDSSARRYFSSPTPGSINGAGTVNLGPLVTEEKHAPAEPSDDENIHVTARVSPTLNAVTNVSLIYRVMYGAETAVQMLDNGLLADGVAGDGIFGAVIPHTAYSRGQMVRYYFVSRDSANNLTRYPPLGDTNNSTLYFGTVVQDPSLTNGLPVLHWFTQGTVNSTAFVRASMYWQGEFYDNIKMNTHGQSSGGFRNHSFNLDFNPDHNFKPDATLPRVDDINLLSSYADKAHMRVMLSYQIYADAGPNSPYHFAVPARMQSNGVFHSIMHIVENGDDKYLERLGRDPNGALYKMYTQPTDPAQAEKKTRRFEDKSDFLALVSGINSATNRTYIYDNVDVSEAINFFAAMIVTASVDCCHKNFYLYRDSEGDHEWEMLPWDLDLSFGRNWQSGETYWDDRVYPNNGLFVGGTFPLGPFLFNNAVTRATYLRRVRTLQDELLQTNGTPAAQLNFERQIDSWEAIMKADGVLDLAKWGTWGGGNGGDGGSSGTRIDSPTSPFYRTLPQSVQELKTNYLVNRRNFVFNQKMGNAAEFPDAQPTNAVVIVGALDYNPSSANQAQEYLQLINTNNYAVDISGWKLAGAVEHTFQAGVVIPRAASSNILYVVADKKAFRARTVAPRGGMGLYIEGPYKGQLSARGETIFLSNKVGRLVASNAFLGNPTPAQQSLRITEIMYHPPNPPSGPYEAEDFEFIELKNIGGTALDLTGVHFQSGVEFSFTGSAVTNLAAGQYVLVVRNIAAFTARYGPGFNIAGQYIGTLANEGEEISLYDRVGEQVLDFEYDNAWYPVTDGPGASLVIVNENAAFNTWGLKQSWRPSYRDFGGPGQADPPLVAVAPVLINEVLTHTDLPLVDAVELFNTNAAPVNIGGWFLTDDFATPKKYRIPAGTTLQPGGYLVLDETQFNTNTVPNPFSFSSKGDEAYLFSGDGTNLTGYLHGYEFGGAENGVSFGRHVNSQTNVHFVAQSARTFGGANALPKVGPVILSEISYHPVDGAGGSDNQLDEFIELANISGSPVPLQNAANTWRLRSAVDFDFPAGVTLPAGGRLIVVSFNPTNTPLLEGFRARWNVGAGIPFYGPYDGQLDNSSESVRLYRPDSPEGIEVPYILVDQVDYSDLLPWPAAADGIGPTLQKLTESAYGNDPVNWVAVGPSPGNPYVAGGAPPSITVPPANTSVILGNSGFFSVTATGTAPLYYQWRYKGTNIPLANFSTFSLPAVQQNQAGPYSVIVYNSAGSIESASGVLTVLIPASITLAPTDVRVRVRPDPAAAATTNATFQVGASSSTPLRYQWRRSGTNLPNATSATLTITNVQVSDDGDYSAAITDDVGTIFSLPARLIPLVTPVIVQAPLTNTVPQGGVVSVSVALGDGNPKPFYYEWRRGSPAVARFTNDFKTNIFTFVNTNAVGTVQQYRVVVTNLANLSPTAVSTTFNIITIADTDRDGMSDQFEIAYGLNTNNVNDAAGDLDGDTMTNLEESLAGTDPTNASSYLRVDNSRLPGATILYVAAVSNRTYSVQFTDELSSAGPSVWTKAADIVASATNRVETLTVTNSTARRFWRIALPAQP